jgi:DNA modification methylase
MIEAQELLTIKEASRWASKKLGKQVTSSNIAYLIQYGRIKRQEENGSTRILKNELLAYYDSYAESRARSWKTKFGDELNWTLSFDQYKEADTTKHVHRLHPYKGKFIPQLVAYFLDGHTDIFKKEAFIKKGDIILDPFCGSGTTLVQSAELGIHAIGIDVSAFNMIISNSKITRYNLVELKREIDRTGGVLKNYLKNVQTPAFEDDLQKALYVFNNTHFPVPEYKYRLKQGQIDEAGFAMEKEMEFLAIYNQLVKRHKIQITQKTKNGFLDKWYSPSIRKEFELVANEIKKIPDEEITHMMQIILSRTIRSCRSTGHSDLGTLIQPVTAPYYCVKHGKICKPLFSIFKWWQRYSKDTLNRLEEFDQLRTNTFQICLSGDSRKINIIQELEKKNPSFAELLGRKKIKAIFSSPPYVGLIDYHEQHAYAYDIFGFNRNDALEIGPLSKGKSRIAQQNYMQGISEVLTNCKKFMVADFDVFLVANDSYQLYPTIAENAGMKIVNQYVRPVLNRTEKDKIAYAETIFHLKKR